jgi:hypothetical protein
MASQGQLGEALKFLDVTSHGRPGMRTITLNVLFFAPRDWGWCLQKISLTCYRVMWRVGGFCWCF